MFRTTVQRPYENYENIDIIVLQKVFKKINLYGKIQIAKIIEWEGKQ